MLLRKARPEPAGYPIAGPDGQPLHIPLEVGAEDAYPPLHEHAAISDYFAEHGYVVLRGVVPPELCDEARAAFESELRPYGGFLYRQATAEPERHVWTAGGHMLNSLLNVQDLPSRRFPRFRAAGLDILTERRLVEAVAAIMGERPKIVQTMFFEGNPKTWAHQDT